MFVDCLVGQDAVVVVLNFFKLEGSLPWGEIRCCSLKGLIERKEGGGGREQWEGGREGGREQ